MQFGAMVDLDVGWYGPVVFSLCGNLLECRCSVHSGENIPMGRGEGMS
jgi:hypothetical protein